MIIMGKNKKARKNGAGLLRVLLFAFMALCFAAGFLAAAKDPGTGSTSTSSNYTYFGLALAIPIAIVAIAYMGSYAFNVPSLRAVLQDELLQILATGAVALTLIGTQAVVDQYLVDVLSAASGATLPPAGAMAAAQSTLVGLRNGATGVISNFEEVSIQLGQEASKGVFCNFMGVGFSLSNCSPFNAYRGSLTAAAFTTTVALSDTYAQEYILSLARNFAFSLIIPLGLFLRCFRASRAAGGALIAIGFGFYTVYPAVILATDSLLHGAGAPPATAPALPLMGTCDPMEAKVSKSLSEFTDYGGQLTQYVQAKNLAYFVLVRVLFLSVLNLIVTLAFIRSFAHMIGSDIDVSALARIS